MVASEHGINCDRHATSVDHKSDVVASNVQSALMQLKRIVSVDSYFLSVD